MQICSRYTSPGSCGSSPARESGLSCISGAHLLQVRLDRGNLETHVLAELQVGQGIAAAAAGVVIHPRNGYLEQAGDIFHSQKVGKSELSIRMYDCRS